MAQSGKLHITRAGVQDAALITELGITTFCEAFMKDNKPEDMEKYMAEEMNINRLTEELHDADNIFFLANLHNETIGYAKMRTAKTPAELVNKNPVELERIYVLQAYHDQKIGAALLGHCIAYALDKQRDTMWLGVWEHNHRAVSFYKKWGFEFFGSHIFRLGDDLQTDMLMKKDLRLHKLPAL